MNKRILHNDTKEIHIIMKYLKTIVLHFCLENLKEIDQVLNLSKPQVLNQEEIIKLVGP